MSIKIYRYSRALGILYPASKHINLVNETVTQIKLKRLLAPRDTWSISVSTNDDPDNYFTPRILNCITEDIVTHIFRNAETKRRTKEHALFDNLVESCASCYAELKLQYFDIIGQPDFEIPDRAEPDIGDIPEDFASTLDDKEMTVACTTLAPKYQFKNPPYLFCVGEPGVGKTTLLKKFRHDDMTLWCDRLTENALLPGRADDEEEFYSTLSAGKGKCIIFNEGSTFFAGRPDVVQKHVALITDSFGNDIMYVDDAMGHHPIQVGSTMIIGLIPRVYKKNLIYINDLGNRFLVLDFKTDRNNQHRESDKTNKDLDDRAQLIHSFIMRAFHFHPTLDIKATDEMYTEAAQFSEIITLLRSIFWVNQRHAGEHQDRLMNQLVNLALCRAILMEHDPTMEDVKFFEHLAYRTIPFAELMKRFADDPWNENDWYPDRRSVFSIKKGEKVRYSEAEFWRRLQLVGATITHPDSTEENPMEFLKESWVDVLKGVCKDVDVLPNITSDMVESGTLEADGSVRKVIPSSVDITDQLTEIFES